MSRIRSVHPALFTDEAFMAASPHARMFLIGLWCECDDQGVFEWKPLTLKARLLPVDAVTAGDLLSELVSLNFIRQFEVHGKPYGAVRNFRKYQRPQKPSAHFPLPDDLRSYVGLSDTDTVAVGEQSRSGTVKSPQMEDGGGKRDKKDEGEDSHPEKPEPDIGAAAPRTARGGRAYFFESGVIRLTEPDFLKWEQAFPNVSLRSELMGLAGWAGEQPNWFFAVQGALAKRNREAGLFAEQARISAIAAANAPPKPKIAYLGP